ncbi:Xaa-Pro aminopeptidase [Halogranum rubrum]|uniref:Xaa-Pro aminopeptidase n=1 Tax=Halogranum rubrum TaxID=553466 RepID=A0A1I4GZL8_9EURY|nr:Xaa-Pro peptidase family protein [Halogranum rubrum]SFL34873.1 Xaa-Pro aminopeptidase [Halogranum rubrum]
MGTTYAALDERLSDLDVDGYLLDADGEDSNQYYLSGYHAPDRFITLYSQRGVVLLMSGLEYTRAKTDSSADEVRKLSEFEYAANVEAFGPTEGRIRSLVDFLAAYDIDSVAVPETFPTGVADGLREFDISVVADAEDTVDTIRAVKSAEEIEHIRTAQKANEAAVRTVEALLTDATIDGEFLYYEGEKLTSEFARTAVEKTLIDHGCSLDDSIIACGPDSARAHERGSGPLRAHTNITVDIFPKHNATGYNADMTRTFVKGEPSEQVTEWYELTYDAYRAALDTVRAGITGEDVHDAVCDVYEAAGYPTLRTDESTEDGFFHSTGHGVGLDVHEAPRIGLGGEELKAGHVITIEPGLYEQGVGGVRIEDLVVVTEDGYENLTEYHTDLVID